MFFLWGGRGGGHSSEDVDLEDKSSVNEKSIFAAAFVQLRHMESSVGDLAERTDRIEN